MEFKPFEKKVWLASPTMHGEELKYMSEAYQTNWMSTVGENIDTVERCIAEKTGCGYTVGVSCGTAALHLCFRLAGVKRGDTVLSSDTTFNATINPAVYEGAVPVFVDSEYETWNMDPVALRRAFELHPEAKVVVCTNLYGTPAKLDEIRKICDEHGAILVEDAAESFGAEYKGKQTGTYGTYNTISFNGNKIITGSAGGMVLTGDKDAAAKARKWSTQSKEPAPWYQNEEIGYNYRMSNVIAGVVRGQLGYLDEHIAKKKAIYMRYKEGLRNLPVKMNPYDAENSKPNFWLSCIIINKEAMCSQTRDTRKASFVKEKGKSCPTEILETLAKYNAEGRPIWKPMHMQPMYAGCDFVTADGVTDVGADLFERGLCLPSDIKMTEEEQDKVIEIVKSCF